MTAGATIMDLRSLLVRENSDEAASTSATWLIPLLLVVLLVGICFAGLKLLKPFKLLWTRNIRSLWNIKRSRPVHRREKFDIAEEEKGIATPGTSEPRFVIPIANSTESPIVFSGQPFGLGIFTPEEFPVLSSSFSAATIESINLQSILDSGKFSTQLINTPAPESVLNLPVLCFTPPTLDDIASAAVVTTEGCLQPPKIDRFGRALPTSTSLPSLSKAGRKAKSGVYRSMSVMGSSILGTRVSLEEEFVGNFLTALYNPENIAKRFQDGSAPQKERSRTGRRDSITVKVEVRSSDDLWKFWVPSTETLQDFKARVGEKVGNNVELFTAKGTVISTEEEWRIVDVEHKVIATHV